MQCFLNYIGSCVLRYLAEFYSSFCIDFIFFFWPFFKRWPWMTGKPPKIECIVILENIDWHILWYPHIKLIYTDNQCVFIKCLCRICTQVKCNYELNLKHTNQILCRLLSLSNWQTTVSLIRTDFDQILSSHIKSITKTAQVR